MRTLYLSKKLKPIASCRNVAIKYGNNHIVRQTMVLI